MQEIDQFGVDRYLNFTFGKHKNEQKHTIHSDHTLFTQCSRSAERHTMSIEHGLSHHKYFSSFEGMKERLHYEWNTYFQSPPTSHFSIVRG